MSARMLDLGPPWQEYCKPVGLRHFMLTNDIEACIDMQLHARAKLSLGCAESILARALTQGCSFQRFGIIVPLILQHLLQPCQGNFRSACSVCSFLAASEHGPSCNKRSAASLCNLVYIYIYIYPALPTTQI